MQLVRLTERGRISDKLAEAGGSTEYFTVVNLANELMRCAQVSGASDIHIDPGPQAVRVRLRVDGILQTLCEYPLAVQNEFVSRVKILAGLRTDEHFVPQDGRFRTTLDGFGEPLDVRVSIMPTQHGENVVLRLLAAKIAHETLSSLGFSSAHCDTLESAVHRPGGMILATGPTGSGKTTTLYALLRLIDSTQASVVTIEDPIEYALDGSVQVQVHPRAGLTFASGLRAVLRQDPNIIMVGEIRDSETAGVAVNAALTGHLLLSTLHTTDAVTALPRLLDLKIEPYLAVSTVRVVIAQRLIRTICQDCKRDRALTEGELERVWEICPEVFSKSDLATAVGVGCAACQQSGYRGRTGVYEVLQLGEDMNAAILRKASAKELLRLARSAGMQAMLSDGVRKALNGTTTFAEVYRTLYAS